LVIGIISISSWAKSITHYQGVIITIINPGISQNVGQKRGSFEYEKSTATEEQNFWNWG
jgi:hypothetical protein